MTDRINLTPPVALWVAVNTPAHSAISGLLTYTHPEHLPPGTLVRVPLGKRETLGVVWGRAESDQENAGASPAQLKPISLVLSELPALDVAWLELMSFAARYYQRSIGEVALSALPLGLRDLDATQLARRIKRLKNNQNPAPKAPVQQAGTDRSATQSATYSRALTPEQASSLDTFYANQGPFLLFGATGSGKTEVYLSLIENLLAADSQAQALILVPEINLTPQLEDRLRQRFESRLGPNGLVSMHSGMTPAQRLQSWLSAHFGPDASGARLVLGTRMAILASLPRLRLIVVDEEHDPSYKQQEGARYSARDLAVYRGQLISKLKAAPLDQGTEAHCKVLLGSATPSLESWHLSRPNSERNRSYLRLEMPSRVGGGDLPRVRLVDMRAQPRGTLLSPALVDAISQRVARGEQAMLLLNRRGFAPVLHCADCGWKSECPHCSAFRVFHKIDRSLRCHHCGLASAVPRACPVCGNIDIAPLGRGTERLQEQLVALLDSVRRPNGQMLRIGRIDADSTKAQGALQTQLQQVHQGEVDVLVGTQMIAKGHDFRNITLVAALETDGALFSSDFRSPERLFSLLMQSAGRSGRDAERSRHSEMWVQTHFPEHPLFAALVAHDYPRFAEMQLAERWQAQLPPFCFHALARADAKTQAAAQWLLNTAAEQSRTLAEQLGVTLYPAVPLAVQRVANVERAQLLLESASRPALQHFLNHFQQQLQPLRQYKETQGLLRWAIDVDPLQI